MTSPHLSYRARLIVRIALILSVGFAGIIIAIETPYWLVSVWLGLFIVILVIELIRFHERSKKVLREFLNSINQGDFSTLGTIDENDKELQHAYQLIMDKFRFLRIEKEIHYNYLQRIIEHVDTALICLDKDQNIRLINRSANDLLKISKIRDLRALEKTDSNLVSLIRKIRSGQREMISLARHGKILNLTVRATEFVLEKDTYKIISFQDIKSELDEQEVDSWQKLVRVLTHEIMNSTIPITNMVGIAREFLVNEKGIPKKIPGLSKEEINDLVESLTVAESRSKGLVNFIQKTKSLTRIPKPSFREIKVSDLFIRIKDLFKKELESSGIELKIILLTPEMDLKADLELIEQVLINLIRNAIEALDEIRDPMIELSAGKNQAGSIVVIVRDNGKGIEKDYLDQVFIPFYSTKKDGSGIGLSLSRQIMKLHRGRIDVESEPGKGTIVRLEF